MPVTTEAQNSVRRRIDSRSLTRHDIVLCAKGRDEWNLISCDRGRTGSPVGNIELLTLDRGSCII